MKPPNQIQQLIRNRYNDDDWILSYWCSDAQGRPSNGGSGEIVEPDTIQTVEGELDVCPDPPETVGLHATTEPHRWRGDRVWLVALKRPVKREINTAASKKRHILTDIDPSQVWSPKVAARLEMSNLWGADLRGAYLRSAELQGADLRDAYLRGANLVAAHIRKADLRGAYLRGANLYGAGLNESDLRNADLRGANLYGAGLTGADLRGADLRGANLEEARINASQIEAARTNESTKILYYGGLQ